jgi:hypothetical protein
MASGHVTRANRPNTWLLRHLLHVKKALANPEPSAHDPGRAPGGSASWGAAAATEVDRQSERRGCC